jgi:hypothetical protein
VKAARKAAHAQQRNKRAMKRFGPTRWNGDLHWQYPYSFFDAEKRQAAELASEF